MSTNNFLQLQEEQKKIYSRNWDKYDWKGERLYPVRLPLEDILKGSTARLHVPHPPAQYNVIGTPRSGTKWLQKIISLLLKPQNPNLLSLLFAKLYPPFAKTDNVGHFHEGVIDDFTSGQKVIFIYRDIRDAIVSGYFYIKNELHGGTMGSTTNNFKRLDFEEGLTSHIIMYMKYRMPVMVYWLNVKAENVITVRYEDLLIDREKWIRIINEKLGINATEDAIQRTLQQSSWEHMSGRKPGIENVKSHQRKGVTGDWRKHFTERHANIFRNMGGEDLLREMGYEV